MSIWGNDLNLISSNPALLNPSMGRQAALNYCKYVAGMNLTNVAYAHDLKKAGTAALSLQAFNYGSFVGYDELGQKGADFKASDYSINLHFARPMADSMFNIGVSLKTILSQYQIYNSYGTALDFGVTYHNKKNFVVSLVAKNVGFIWKSYWKDEPEALPNTVQLGFSKKIYKAPFKLSVVYDQLLKWDLKYISPIDTAGKFSSINSSSAEDSTDFARFGNRFGSRADNLLRHMILGTEIIITKNFWLTIGYNYRRQREMTLPERRGANGLSFGFGIRIRRFGFAYSFAKMAFPGNSNLLGLTFAW